MHLNLSKKIFFIGLFFLTLSACSSLKEGTKHPKNNNLTDSKKRTDNKKNFKPPYNPSRTLENDLIHTKLEVRFDWEKQHVLGTATLTFKPYFYPQSSLILDAKGMDIHQVKLLGSGSETTLKYSYDQRKLSIQLPSTYTSKDTFIVFIDYTAKPAELPNQGSVAITDDRGLYFINHDGKNPNKPKQIWTQGETEASSCWFPTIDSPNEKTTQEIFITVGSEFTVLSNGEHIYSKMNQDGTKTEYWKMDLPHAPYLFMMAIGDFKVVHDKWNDIEVNYYVEPKFEKHAKAIFGNTPEMIQFFSTKLRYNYPWNKYSQVVVRDFVSGAMENTTATLFMESVQCEERELLDNNWDGIIAHELFHHWFGDLVTCESWANLPLNESFANYAEYLWAEYKYGREEADYLDVKEEDEYFEEFDGKREPLIRFHYIDKDDMFDRHSYNKGGRVLHMLRHYVGEEAFFTSLNLYLTRKQFQTAEIHDLRLAFEETTGEDLNWFFSQWFLSPGHPELKVQHSYENGILKLSFLQLQDTIAFPVYKLPLLVDINVNDSIIRRSITITKSKQSFSIPLSKAPSNVLVDAEFQLLGKIFHDKTEAELSYQLLHSKRFRSRMVALEKLFAPKDKNDHSNPFLDPKKIAALQIALKDSFWVIREYALEQFSKYTVPSLDVLLPSIEEIAMKDPKPAVRSRAISMLASLDANKYLKVFENGLNAEPYSVVSASLSGYLKSDATNKELKVSQFEKNENGDILITIADYFLFTKNLQKYDWFKNKISTTSGKDLYFLLGYYGEYIKLMKGADREDGKKTLQSIIDQSNHEWIKQIAKKYLKEIN